MALIARIYTRGVKLYYWNYWNRTQDLLRHNRPYAHPVIHHIFPFSQLIDAFSKFAIRNVDLQETSVAERGAFTQPLAERNHRRRRHRRTTPVAAASSFEARPEAEGRRRRRLQRVRRRTLHQHGHQRRGGQRRRPVRGRVRSQRPEIH